MNHMNDIATLEQENRQMRARMERLEKENQLLVRNLAEPVYAKIRSWAEDRNLIQGSDPKSQLLKTMEELGELASAVSKSKMEGIIDGIGDVVVTLVIVSAQFNLNFESCVESAYNEIKDRKGKMINGVFVKEADL